MKKISLKSSARLSDVAFKDFVDGRSVDVVYHSDGSSLAGTYQWEEVKQFVRELAEALDMTLEEAIPKVEPIVLPKDVYEEVAEMRGDVVNASNPKSAADYMLWDKCSSPKDSNAVSDWINNTTGATIDLAKMLMGELPFECESDPKWVLRGHQSHYLSKACINDTGGWSMKFTLDIEEAIKFHSRKSAEDFSNSVSQHVPLSVKEV